MNMKLTNSVHRIVAAVMTTVAMVCLTACSDNGGDGVLDSL